MKRISEKHQKMLDWILKFNSDNGYPPTIRETAAANGFKSTNTVWVAVSRMENKGIAVPVKRNGERSSDLDPDIKALSICIAALSNCTKEGQRANVQYLNSKFGV